jgi:hypothetical protein
VLDGGNRKEYYPFILAARRKQMTTATIHTDSVYVKDTEGRTCHLAGRQFKKLKKEILAGRGGKEVADLIASGYVEFLADDGQCYCIESICPETFQK